ncbi:CocE/NonD family hydrolase [Geothrix sp. PMB-07]|uniref:CocE/NonD family hydrolase n=1 Tax=Geothrix sp. PMB-07 TaxID=3068640 RepID=UPI002740B0F4|nr:CocE/NonD family hydrolase [Geothrix sp. PMB-07]WLT31593.1 CocE/NonD family hydrolase [Geothrix sp. PMB-07]
MLRSGFLPMATLTLTLVPGGLQAQAPSQPNEMPAAFKVATDSWDYLRREEMIPMRDGTRLRTIILIPKGAKEAPILLTRTPYNAAELTGHAHSAHLEPILQGYDNVADLIVEGGYIRVVQDIRGKYGSEGEYVMNRPLQGPLNPSAVDHSTDTYDTIDWLVKHLPESNGRVGILGISYDGFLPLMALVNPHPALKAAVPMNPMVDGWRGDDWFHNGAFRAQNLTYIYEQQATRGNDAKWWSSHYDDYDMFLQAGSTGELARRRGMEQLGFWRKVAEHPAYDSFWQQQAMDRVLAERPLTVPTLLVHSLYDAEDIYGAIAVWKALKPKDSGNLLHLAMGPWNHGGEIGDGSSLGPLKFSQDTGLQFRQNVLRAFLEEHLREKGPKADLAPVTAFETGTNAWRRLPGWPVAGGGTAIAATPFYLGAGLKVRVTPPKAGEAPFEAYVSNPAKPVPFRARPILPVGYDALHTWPQWLTDDQREASGRTDVLAFISEPLSAPLRISGEPVANLVAATSGTDADWVVKVIDVYPDEVAAQPAMGGFQLMVSADIFRGRYRESLDAPKALKADAPLVYRFALPTANHVFLPGHRVMVQIQSSWFPLYDRNPQTFVPNIFFAKPEDYRPATQRIYHAPGQASFVELPVVK